MEIINNYWVIYHTPDTTETGLPMKNTYVKTTWNGFPVQHSIRAESDILFDYCVSRFGAKTAYVQGVAPCSAWDIKQIDEIKYQKATPINWGGFDMPTEKIELNIGKR